MRAIAFALLAIGAEFAIQSAKDDNSSGMNYFRLVVGWFGAMCALSALILAIMGL